MKNLKIITTLICTALSILAYGQIPASPGPQLVTDPSNNAQLVKTVDNTLRTLTISKESLEITKKSLETAKKINSTLQSAQMTVEITNNLTDTYGFLSKVPDMMGKVKNPTVKKNLIKTCNELFIDINVFQDTIGNVLTDNILSMDDADRLNTLMSLYEKSKNIRYQSERLIISIKKVR